MERIKEGEGLVERKKKGRGLGGRVEERKRAW